MSIACEPSITKHNANAASASDLTALELHQEVRPRARDAAAAAAAAFPACGAAPRLSNAPCFVLLRRASVCSC